MRQTTEFLVSLLTALIVLFISFALFGWMVQILWNTCLVPAVTVCQPISFIQTVGLIALVHLLCRLATLNTDNKEKRSEDN